MKPSSKIFVAGHRGLVGSAIVRALEARGHTSLVLKTRQELDLLNQAAVHQFFKDQKIDYVFLAAAKVGGIHANATYSADFLYENLVIATNIIHASANSSVEKLLFLGSSCIYPKLAPQPLKEEYLLTGPLEESNQAYALAKIAGLKLCEMYQKQYSKRFISAMPTNMYGIGDNFHPMNSHVIPGMMRRFHEAKIAKNPAVTIWGSGKPLREFLHCDDLASALLLLMEKYESPQTINVGSGKECTILELAQLMKEATGYAGELVMDPTKPDGTPRKILDISRISAMGWQPSYDLKRGLSTTYAWALKQGVFNSVSS